MALTDMPPSISSSCTSIRDLMMLVVLRTGEREPHVFNVGIAGRLPYCPVEFGGTLAVGMANYTALMMGQSVLEYSVYVISTLNNFRISSTRLQHLEDPTSTFRHPGWLHIYFQRSFRDIVSVKVYLMAGYFDDKNGTSHHTSSSHDPAPALSPSPCPSGSCPAPQSVLHLYISSPYPTSITVDM